eukprot:2726893-Amphidinium_carterae.1
MHAELQLTCGMPRFSTDRWMQALMKRDSDRRGRRREQEFINSRSRIQREKNRDGPGGVC